MTSWIKTIFIAGVAVAVLGTGVTPLAAADMGAVKERKATMKAISKANKSVQGAAKGKVEAKKAAAEAEKIVALISKFPGWFPKGTSREDAGMMKSTRAKPDIWAKMDTFKSRANGLKSAAQNFVKVAASGDQAAIAAAAAEVRKACGACHKSFRGPKPK